MGTKIPLNYLSIDNEGIHLMIQSLVNGLKANLLIDTGASRTVLDVKRINYYEPGAKLRKNNKFFSGIGAGDIETYLAPISLIELGETKIKDHIVVLFDLKVINQSYAVFDLPKIDGVLGGDVLKACNAMIDYKNGFLILE